MLREAGPSRAGHHVVLAVVSAAEATPRQCRHDQWDQVGSAVVKASVVASGAASEVGLEAIVAATEASAAVVTLEAAEVASVEVSEEAAGAVIAVAVIASAVVTVDLARALRTALAHHQTHPTDRAEDLADPVAAVTEETFPDRAVGMVAVMVVAHMMTDPVTAEVIVGEVATVVATAAGTGMPARAAATWSPYALVTISVVGMAAETMTGLATTTAPGSVDTKATAGTRIPGNCVATSRTTSSDLLSVSWWVYLRLFLARLSVSSHQLPFCHQG